MPAAGEIIKRQSARAKCGYAAHIKIPHSICLKIAAAPKIVFTEKITFSGCRAVRHCCQIAVAQQKGARHCRCDRALKIRLMYGIIKAFQFLRQFIPLHLHSKPSRLHGFNISIATSLS